MEKPEKTFKVGKYTVKIYQDTDASSPDEWGNTDLFLTGYHSREFWVNRKNFEQEQIETHLEEGEGLYRGYHVIPLYAYIHSGVALSVSCNSYPFNDRWDSGQVGYVFADSKQWTSIEDAYKAAESLVSEWNQYLSGDVYGYVIEDSEGNEIQSCWGYYGIEYCEDDARGVAEYQIKQDVKKHLSTLKNWVKNRVPLIKRHALAI